MSEKHIGKKLKELRTSRDLKQLEVAEGVGLSRTAISNIESGRRALTLNTLKKFADFYKVDVSTITQEFEQNSKNELIDLVERTRKIFNSEKVSKDDKEELYLTLMTMYLNSKKH